MTQNFERSRDGMVHTPKPSSPPVFWAMSSASPTPLRHPRYTLRLWRPSPDIRLVHNGRLSCQVNSRRREGNGYPHLSSTILHADGLPLAVKARRPAEECMFENKAKTDRRVHRERLVRLEIDPRGTDVTRGATAALQLVAEPLTDADFLCPNIHANCPRCGIWRPLA